MTSVNNDPIGIKLDAVANEVQLKQPKEEKPPSVDLSQFIVTTSDEIRFLKPAVTFDNKTLIKRGELMAIVALPSTGKTHFCTQLHATYLGSNDNWGFIFDRQENGISIHIDTERTKDDCISSIRVLVKRMEGDTTDIDKYHKQYHLYEVSKPESLRQILEAILDQHENIDLVTIDGILEFCENMNDPESSSNTVKWLRALIGKCNAYCIITMHPNKGTTNMAGHLGAFIYRYCRACLLLHRPNGSGIREITPDIKVFAQGKLSHTDAANFTPLYFQWNNEKGMFDRCEAGDAKDENNGSKFTDHPPEFIYNSFNRALKGEVLKSSLFRELLVKEFEDIQINIKSRSKQSDWINAAKIEGMILHCNAKGEEKYNAPSSHSYYKINPNWVPC